MWGQQPSAVRRPGLIGPQSQVGCGKSLDEARKKASERKAFAQRRSVIGPIPTFPLAVHPEHQVCGLNHPDRSIGALQCGHKGWEHTLVVSLSQPDHSFFAHIFVRVVETPDKSFTKLDTITIA